MSTQVSEFFRTVTGPAHTKIMAVDVTDTSTAIALAPFFANALAAGHYLSLVNDGDAKLYFMFATSESAVADPAARDGAMGDRRCWPLAAGSERSEIVPREATHLIVIGEDATVLRVCVTSEYAR